MAWKIETGMAKASLWPDPGNGSVWIPTDDESDEIMSLPGVSEVSSEGAQSYKIIVEADSLDELAEVVSRVSRDALQIIRRYIGERRKQSRLALSPWGKYS